VIAVIVSVCSLYIGFGLFCSFAWGGEMKTPLVTDQLPQFPDKDGGVVYFIYTVLFLFSLNLVFSYPLQIDPVNIIVENIVFDGWEKSRKRQMFKNMTRSSVICLCIVFTIMLGDKLDKFLSILGSVTCTPMAFTFPALFHLKACAETTFQKIIDISIILLSVVIFFYCTYQGILGWGA
jgi:amino acid permease